MHSERNVEVKNQPIRKRGLVTSLAAVATAVMMALSTAPAHAEPTPAPTVPEQQQGSIIIHKYEQPDALGKESTGLEQKVDGTPLEGIEFTAQRVEGIDLTTNAGWEKATEVSLADVANLPKDVERSVTTDQAGLAIIDDLPLGLYYVSETSFGPDITPAVPFLVTLPLTHPNELNSWLYDVHIYPKNATTTATKTVMDQDSVKLGDTVEWTILSDIPKAQIIDGYKVVDELDSKLAFVGFDVSLTGEPGVELDENDYSVDFTDPNTGTLVFTAPGLKKLQAAWQKDATSQIKGVVTTKVLKVGEIENVATVFPNKASNGFSTGSAITKFGTIVLDKVDSKNGKKLDGAEFQVFLTEADAKAKTNPITINKGTAAAEDTFVSKDGVVRIEGLRYSNWANGQAVEKGDANYRSYWIAETKAPEGYELLAQPIQVDVTSFQETASVEVKNVPKNAGFALPLTGASGAATMFTAAGLLLLGLGTTAVVVSRRKKVQAQA